MATDDLYSVFQSRYSFILDGIKSSLGDLAPKLFERGLIDRSTRQTATSPSMPTCDCANAVMESLDAIIRTDPSAVYKLLSVLKLYNDEFPVLRAVASDLNQRLPLPLQERQQTSSHPRVATSAHSCLPTDESAANYVIGTLPPAHLIPTRTQTLLPQAAYPVNPPGPPSLDELMDKYRIKAAVRRQVCSDVFLAEVAAKMGDVDLQHVHLNLLSSETSSQDTPHQLLKRWKDRYIYKATLETLVQCLWSVGKYNHVVMCLDLSSTHFPTTLPKGDLSGPRMVAGRVAEQQPPTSSDTAQSYPSVSLDAQPPKASPVIERISDTPMPHSPTSNRDMCSHVPSSTHHPEGPTHYPADPTLHPADPTHHPAGPTHHPVGTTHHPVDPTHHPVCPTNHPVGPALHPADPTLHPANPTHHPADPTHHPVGPTHHPVGPTHQLRKRDLTGPRVETGRVAVPQPASGNVAQSYDSFPFPDMDAHALSPKISPEPISATTTTMPVSPTSLTSDHMSPISPISDLISPTSPISNRMSSASRFASVYPPSLQATLPEMDMPSRSYSTDSSGSTDSYDSFHSAFSSLSLSDTDETLLKGAEKQLHDQLEKLRLRMSRKDMTNFQLERELKDTKAEKCKLEQLVLDLQEKVAELEQERRERAQQATASSLAQIASLRKDLDEHLDATNSYLAQLIRSTCRSE